MQLSRGRFRAGRRLELHPLGDGSQRACRVELSLHYGFDSAALAPWWGRCLTALPASLVDAFVKRAEQVYG
jgi:ribosome-associated toxin RatA of RatAB toxin-antitoxin module